MKPPFLVLLVAAMAWCPPAVTRSEIVERELGTDASGNPVIGPVFQGGREFRRSRRDAGLRSGLPVARPYRTYRSYRPGWTSGTWGGPPVWYVPWVPLHWCGGPAAGGFDPLWRGWGGSFGVTLFR